MTLKNACGPHSNNHQLITPKKNKTKEIKYIFLRNKNELPKKKNLTHTTKKSIKKNKTTYIYDN